MGQKILLQMKMLLRSPGVVVVVVVAVACKEMLDLSLRMSAGDCYILLHDDLLHTGTLMMAESDPATLNESDHVSKIGRSLLQQH
jgi:hypothetical protein